MAASSSSLSNTLAELEDHEEERVSPIRYRVGPLDYYPPVKCKCDKKAALWISWSDENPGRRYLKCYYARSGGCDFYGWYEGPHDAFVQTLLVDLRNAVWLVKKKRAIMKQAVKEAVERIDELERSEDELKQEVQRLLAVAAEKQVLEVKVKKMSMQNLFLMASCAAIFAVFAWFLVR